VNSRVWMYVRANQLDPNCKLFVNEYTGNSFGGFDGTTYANYITTLQSKGAPIHGIGIQGHISTPFDDTAAQSYWTSVLKPLGTKGLPIWATEFDSDTTSDSQRATDLDNYYRICFSDPNVYGILMWGFMVGTTWRASGAWGLVDSSGNLNGAGTRYESLMSQWTTKTSSTTDSNGNASFRGFHGTYKITLSKTGQTTEVHTIELVPDTNNTTQQFIIDTNFTTGTQTYTITASADANGTISPSGTFDVNSGSSQLFTATPNTGYDVNQWKVDGNVVDSNSTTYTLSNITANHTVNVTFRIKTFTITASADVNGTISPSGTFNVNYNSNQQFTATPNTGYDVNQWKVDGNVVDSNNTTYTLSNITANHTVNVTFRIKTFTITASADANGSISPSGTFNVNYNSSQQFTATPSTGYDVNTWSVDGSTVQSGGATYTLSNITANHTVAVTFKIKTFTITASAGTNGSVAPTSVAVNYGSSQDFNAAPSTGYEVDKWTVDGNDVQTGGTTYTLSNITANHTVAVTFSQITLSISGYILEPDGNTPVQGVLMHTDDNDVNAVTDVNGYYKLLVDYNWSGVVTPQKDGFVFEPNSNTYTNVTRDYNDANYTATLMTFKIAGLVLKSDLTPISEVNVSAENGGGPWTSKYGGGSTLTDTKGYYQVMVDYNWSGNVTPVKYAYVFEPNSRYYADVNEDYTTGQDYTGTLLTYRIAGYIKNECNAPIEGVSLSADNGGGQGMTDVNGFYEVWVDCNWSGTVTPSKVYCTFEPNSRSYANVIADQNDQNYIASNVYDLDCDGSIGWGDVAVIGENWLVSGPNVPGDIHKDDDNIVNFLDFADFATAWQNK
jgi:hypothetical protein